MAFPLLRGGDLDMKNNQKRQSNKCFPIQELCQIADSFADRWLQRHIEALGQFAEQGEALVEEEAE